MRTVRRPFATAASTLTIGAALATGLAACGSDDDGVARDAGGASESSASPDSTDTGDSPGGGSPSASAWPEFAPTDYTYRLEVLCFCPQVGQVQVRVVDGEVAAARSVTGPAKGRPAPVFARLTINDIIAKANDPAVAEAEVVWPDGQDHPTSVAIDQIENAIDDEVTYTIKAVQVAP